MDIEKALQELTNTIKTISSSPKLDSEILIMKALKISRAYLYTHKNKKLSSQDISDISAYVAKLPWK